MGCTPLSIHRYSVGIHVTSIGVVVHPPDRDIHVGSKDSAWQHIGIIEPDDIEEVDEAPDGVLLSGNYQDFVTTVDVVRDDLKPLAILVIFLNYEKRGHAH